MYDKILHVADTHIPYKTYSKLKKLPPWLIPELIELMKERDHTYKKAKASGSLVDWILAKKTRNLRNKEMQRAKESYILEQLKVHKKDGKKLWETLNGIYPSGKQKQNNNTEVKLTVNGNIIPDDQVPDYMNE